MISIAKAAAETLLRSVVLMRLFRSPPEHMSSSHAKEMLDCDMEHCPNSPCLSDAVQGQSFVCMHMCTSYVSCRYKSYYIHFQPCLLTLNMMCLHSNNE